MELLEAVKVLAGLTTIIGLMRSRLDEILSALTRYEERLHDLEINFTRCSARADEYLLRMQNTPPAGRAQDVPPVPGESKEV